MDSVEEDIAFWLPYISLNDVDIISSEDMQSLNIKMTFQITNIGANVVINILASENSFTVQEEVEGESGLVQVDTFGADTAFSLGGGGSY